MRRDPDVARVVRSWLDEGVDRLPDHVLDAVLERLPTTPQRRPAWSARRLPTMSTTRRLALAAAALIIAIGATFAVFARGSGPSALPTSSPSPSAPVVPTPPPPASPSPLASASGIKEIGVMEPGTYRIGAPFTVPFTITFPTSWTLKTNTGPSVNFTKTLTEGAAWVSVDVIRNVFVDPCHTDKGVRSPAPRTIAEVATAITQMAGFEAGPVSDVTLNGYGAKALTITNAIDTASAGCSGGPMLPLWTFSGSDGAATNGLATEQVWVVEVRGDLVVIDGESFPTTTTDAVAEIEAVVATIQFGSP